MADRNDLWAHLRMLDLCRRLGADLDGLADTSPRIAEVVVGVRVYLADVVPDRAAADILRGPDLLPIEHHTATVRMGDVR